MRNRSVIPVLATVFAAFAITLLLVSAKVALVVFAGGIVGTIVFFYPYQGLLIYLTMTYLRPQEFIPALKEQPLMLALAFVLLGTLILHAAVGKRPMRVVNTRQNIFMMIFFLVIPLSHLQRFYLTGAQESFSDFLPVFLLFFMIVNLIIDPEQLKKTFYLLFFMTLALSLNGILQYVRGYDIAGQTMYEGRIRWIGIFSDPNDLGLTILAFTPFAMLKLLKKKTGILKRVLWALALAILIYALYLTNSRGTFLGLLAVSTMLLCKRIGLLRGLVIGAVFSVAALALGPSRMSDMSIDEASASGRIDAWATGLNLLFWRPVLGVGYHNFTEHHQLTAHNSVVLCMSELGLIGLYVWLLLIVSSFREMILVQKNAVEGAYAEYAEVMQLSLTGFFVSAFFLSRTYNEVLFILVALSTLISVFSRRRFDYKVHLLDRSLLVSTLVFMILLIAVIKILVMI
jgi:putative inorganic carbon (HCO3(-)) transporter